jgi:hypothetical protein
MACLEKELNQRFNKFICTLHLNELPLRHLITYYIGSTSGPQAFKSDLGRANKDLKDPVIAPFRAIPNPDFPKVDQSVMSNFSHDQKLIHRGCVAVMTGECPSDLASRALGPVNHSRWLTTALRILFLYMTYEHPPHAIQRLANFIIFVTPPKCS